MGKHIWIDTSDSWHEFRFGGSDSKFLKTPAIDCWTHCAKIAQNQMKSECPQPFCCTTTAFLRRVWVRFPWPRGSFLPQHKPPKLNPGCSWTRGASVYVGSAQLCSCCTNLTATRPVKPDQELGQRNQNNTTRSIRATRLTCSFSGLLFLVQCHLFGSASSVPLVWFWGSTDSVLLVWLHWSSSAGPVLLAQFLWSGSTSLIPLV